MRRFLTAVAGALVASAVVSTGAQALQVVPFPGKTGAQHPTRPEFWSTEQVVRGNNTIQVHGSCFEPGLGTKPAGTASASGWSWAASNLADPTFLGEYPYGGTNDPQHNNGNVPYGVVSNVQATWANNVNQTRLALEYQSDIVKKVLNPMNKGLVDETGRATYYREATEGSLDVEITAGLVEYLVYSDSYSTGPIDLDVTAVNKDGSYDILLNTAGLGVDTYAIRFLGCRDLAGEYDLNIANVWAANYYQGSPHDLGAVDFFTNDNESVNDPAAASYIPTAPAGQTPTGGIEQARLGTDNFRCSYNYDGALPTAANGSISFGPNNGPESAGRGPNEATNVVGYGPTDQLTCPSVTIQALPTEVLPLTSGYNGNTDFSCLNRYNNTQNYAGGEWGITTPYPVGTVGGGTPNGFLPICPSGYDPVGIRANSINDYYGRFQVIAPAAASPSATATAAPAAAPAFVAPTNTQAAAAAQQATVNVITASGGSATVTPVAQTPAAATPAAATQTPAAVQQTPAAATQTQTQAAATQTQAAATQTQVAATPAGVTAKASAVQARVLAPAKTVTASKTAPKKTAKVVTKAPVLTKAQAAAKAKATAAAKAKAAAAAKAKAAAAKKVTVKKVTVKK